MNKFYHVPILDYLLAKKLKPATGSIFSLMIVLLIATSGIAQPVNFTGASYSQDFQSISGTNMAPATVASTTMLQVSAQNGGGTVSGWYLYTQQGGTARWGRSTGGNNTGSFYGLYDGAVASNRALGSLGAGGIISYWGIVIQNNSGATISNLTISYDAVINRNPSTTANPYPMSYRVSSTVVASGTATGDGTFNDAAGTWVAGTGFTTPSTGIGAPGAQAAISPLFRIGGAAITQNLTGLNLANGQYLYIRWKETDDADNDASAGIDNFTLCAAPTITTAPVSVNTNTGCTATGVNLGTPITSAPCGLQSLVNNAPAAFPIGATTVTWTLTDNYGNTATSTQTVTVTDAELPAIAAPGSVNAAANEGCAAAGINLGLPVVSDNCSVDTVYNDAPLAFPLGTTTVTWTVKDSSGNTATATQTVTVTDTSAPAIYLLADSVSTGLTGASTTQTPYLKPSLPGVRFKSILAVNDVVGGYRMVGIPDGLGAFDNGNGTFTVLMNHELTNAVGIARAHGSKGTFVSKWVINKSNLSVVSGGDLMQQLYLWNPSTNSFSAGTLALSRFCSADLPGVSAFYHSATGLGTTERIFMNGEESGAEGKAVGHIVTGASAGVSYELPYLGKFAWENSVASPASGAKTVVAGMDDGTGGQVYVYVGKKTNTGTDIDKAGLNNGKLYGIKVTGMPLETNGSVPAVGTRFEMADLGFVQNKTGATLETESIAAGVTTFLRPEDGAWDPKNPNDFYFVTTNSFSAPTRMWRLRFDNVTAPETGGTIEAVLNGTEAIKMLDNIGADNFGYISLVEDVGNNVHIGKVWQYNTATDVLTPVAYHDSTRFISGAANFLTQDEEASGILDVSDILGAGMYLVDVQAHYTPAANATEVVEGGQLLAMYNPNVFGTSTAPDTIRVVATGALTPVNLGTPATADNCSVASVNNNAPSGFPVDTTRVTWTVTDGSGNTATATQVVIVTALNQPPTITITSPTDNSTYAVGQPIILSANANDPDGTINRVEFYNNGVRFLVDNTAPYGFEYIPRGVEAEHYVVTAKAFDNVGDSTTSDTVRVTVESCQGSGTITAEGFTNIPGAYLVNLGSDIDYPNNPDVTLQLTKFEYGPNIGDNYGARVRGYICAPQTGYYTFFIASNDHSELYLSTDDKDINITKIAFVESSSLSFRDWNKSFSQRSVPIRLFKGVKYYIEAVHKESTGLDHLSVGWILPNGVFEGPIPGSRLSPYITSPSALTISANADRTGDFGTAMRRAAQSEIEPQIVDGLEVKALPNPSNSYFTLQIRSNTNESIKIVLTDALGRIVETKAGVQSNGSVQVGNKLTTAGIYFVEVQQGEKKSRLKLVKQ